MKPFEYDNSSVLLSGLIFYTLKGVFMAKAVKRGKRWRCLVFSHYEYEDGKKVRKYKSFTADSKREAERQAAQWEYDKNQKAVADITVRDAIDQYITIKTNVISSSTEDGYRAYLDSGKYAAIENYKVSELDQVILQSWISGLAKKYNPKYVKNIYGLFTGAAGMAGINLDRIAPTLPQGKAPDGHVPYDAELTKLLEYLSKPNKQELRAACLLAAFGSLRRSEICALTPADFDGNIVSVTKGMVRNGRGGWRIQSHAKNDTSNRIAVIPQEIIGMIDLTHERIVNTNPDALTNRFRRAIKYAGMDKSFTLHSLRHYYVSIAHALKLPDQYIMKMGGWKTDYVMKRVYRTTLSDVEKEEQKKLNDHFSKLMQPKCNQTADQPSK